MNSLYEKGQQILLTNRYFWGRGGGGLAMCLAKKFIFLDPIHL